MRHWVKNDGCLLSLSLKNFHLEFSAKPVDYSLSIYLLRLNICPMEFDHTFERSTNAVENFGIVIIIIIIIGGIHD